MVTHWPDLPNYKFQSVIGKACSGHANVWLAKERTRARAVAVRVCMMDHTPVEAIQQEISILRKLNHANVITLEGVFVAGTDICMVLPFMDFGSVTDLTRARFMFGLPEAVIAIVLRDVLQAVQYIHSRDLVHRSIRGSHILVSSVGRARLSGFRYFASAVGEGKRSCSLHEFSPQLKSNLLWLAPEMLQQDLRGYDFKSDVYSVGVSVCEMANGFPPFLDMDHMQMLFEKMRGTVPRLLDDTTLPNDDVEHKEHRNRRFSPHLHNLTELCLRSSPDWRWSATQLLTHQFFKHMKKSKQSLSDLLQPVTPLALDKSPSKEVVSNCSPVTEQPGTSFSWNF